MIHLKSVLSFRRLCELNSLTYAKPFLYPSVTRASVSLTSYIEHLEKLRCDIGLHAAVETFLRLLEVLVFSVVFSFPKCSEILVFPFSNSLCSYFFLDKAFVSSYNRKTHVRQCMISVVTTLAVM